MALVQVTVRVECADAAERDAVLAKIAEDGAGGTVTVDELVVTVVRDAQEDFVGS